jgi:hypothetical protein
MATFCFPPTALPTTRRLPLAVLTREQQPQDWAGTQNNLGIALNYLAQHTEGPQAADYLE